MKRTFVLGRVKELDPILDNFHYYDCPELFERALSLSMMNVLMDCPSTMTLTRSIEVISNETYPSTENSLGEVREDIMELVLLFWRYYRRPVLANFSGCIVEVTGVSYRSQGLIMDIEVTE